MPTVRQLPSLYLRGALANITMKELTPEQIDHVGGVVELVAAHPAMIGHKKEFAVALGRKTIRADYADPAATEQEFKIAIWRAAVHLFYHRNYKFRCAACGSGTYFTKRGKPSPINRKELACPNCHKVAIADPGDAAFKVGEFVHKDVFQDSYKTFTAAQRPPIAQSPILHLDGPKRYEHPQEVLDDPKQLAKYFGEFVWNYLRQQLNENVREEHRKKPQRIAGPADEVITEEVLALCTKYKAHHTYYRNLNPERGFYRILLQTLHTPPEFTAEFNTIVQRAQYHGVAVEFDTGEIRVKSTVDAGIIEALISRPEHVLMLDAFACISDGNDGEPPVNQATYRTVGDERVDADDHIATIESSDVLKAVRNSLPDGSCKMVYDIIIQSGPAYERFSAPPEEGGFGDGPPHIAHIAKFLGTTTRHINQMRQTIKITMLAQGLHPAQLPTNDS